MSFISMPLRDGFPLIQSTMQNAFHVDTCLYTYPYQNLDAIDRGFRRLVWKEYPTQQPSTPLAHDHGKKFVLTKSSLGFYNIVIYLSETPNSDFIAVYPFRDQFPTDKFYRKILSNNHLSPSYLETIRGFYETLPIVDPERVCKTLKDLIAAFDPDFTEIEVQRVDFKDEIHSVVQDPESMRSYQSQNSAAYSRSLSAFLDTLASGNTAETEKKLDALVLLSGLVEGSGPPANTGRLTELNTLCKAKLLTMSIPADQVLELNFSFEKKINNAKKEEYTALSREICRKYTLLVRHYARSEYSRLVQGVIDYIGGHLDEELTLSEFAIRFDRNASSLSAQFKKETGTSLTGYIHTQRIHEAMNCLSTTELSTQDIAERVGIHDMAYFSRLFKKVAGVSPSEYKKSVKKKKR